jgi:hypothetical protein
MYFQPIYLDSQVVVQENFRSFERNLKNTTSNSYRNNRKTWTYHRFDLETDSAPTLLFMCRFLNSYTKNRSKNVTTHRFDLGTDFAPTLFMCRFLSRLQLFGRGPREREPPLPQIMTCMPPVGRYWSHSARSAMGQIPPSHPPSGSRMRPAQVSGIIVFIGGLYSHSLRPSHPGHMGFLLSFSILASEHEINPVAEIFHEPWKYQVAWSQSLAFNQHSIWSSCLLMNRSSDRCGHR